MGFAHEDLMRVKKSFEDNGVSITDWASERGFDRELVYSVLNGRAAGRRGQSHKIAVALGLKEPPAAWPFPARPDQVSPPRPPRSPDETD